MPTRLTPHHSNLVAQLRVVGEHSLSRQSLFQFVLAGPTRATVRAPGVVDDGDCAIAFDLSTQCANTVAMMQPLQTYAWIPSSQCTLSHMTNLPILCTQRCACSIMHRPLTKTYIFACSLTQTALLIYSASSTNTHYCLRRRTLSPSQSVLSVC